MSYPRGGIMSENKYLELPWGIEGTIENLKELKEAMQEKVLLTNLHGRGEKDAEEVAFDFDRAIEALKKQIPKKPIHIEDDETRNTDLYQCPSCDRRFLGKGIAVYCYHCGQALDWSEE